MSSPVPDDADKRLIHAVPWVSDPHRQDETRRLQEQVVEAAQRLERESSGFASQTPARPSQSRTSVGFRLAVAHPSDERGSREELTGRLWAPLRPELMPPPPRNEMGLPGLGLLAGLLGAVGMAAAVALIVTNVVRIPTINAAISGGQGCKEQIRFLHCHGRVGPDPGGPSQRATSRAAGGANWADACNSHSDQRFRSGEAFGCGASDICQSCARSQGCTGAARRSAATGSRAPRTPASGFAFIW